MRVTRILTVHAKCGRTGERDRRGGGLSESPAKILCCSDTRHGGAVTGMIPFNPSLLNPLLMVVPVGMWSKAQPVGEADRPHIHRYAPRRLAAVSGSRVSDEGVPHCRSAATLQSQTSLRKQKHRRAGIPLRISGSSRAAPRRHYPCTGPCRPC